MTAAEILRLNGNLRDSPMMEVVRRFHALIGSRELPYCVVGGMAVIRNGYPRTTTDVDILTFKDAWRKMLPLKGVISSEGIDSCVDSETGIKIHILFCDEDCRSLALKSQRRISPMRTNLSAETLRSSRRKSFRPMIML
ncbi:MAG: hypothetical protein ABSB63_13255 [Spirochaetia bacterium]|jgi:hypothetical protein